MKCDALCAAEASTNYEDLQHVASEDTRQIFAAVPVHDVFATVRSSNALQSDWDCVMTSLDRIVIFEIPKLDFLPMASD